MRILRQSIGGLGNLMFKQAYLIGQMLDGNIPDVYLQGERFWKEHSSTIKDYFSENITSIDKIALHIRRGDYLKADHFHTDLTTTNYYQRAVQLFPNETFLVFCKDNQSKEQDSKDREWVVSFLNEFISEDGWEFASFENTEVEDMNLMASCKSIIMANSSFSWWASFLNPNKDKRIICPKQWFVDGIERTELLDEWIKL